MSLNLIIISAIVFILLLIVILIFVLFKITKSSSTSETKSKNESRKIYIISLDLPAGVENISKEDILPACKSVYSVLKMLGFKDKTMKDLEINQWHSWQISMLFKLYKYNKDFFIPNKEEIFHPELLNISDTSLNYLMNDIMFKYKKNVKTDKSKDYLCKEIKWTTREISIIFLFLSKYKEF